MSPCRGVAICPVPELLDFALRLPADSMKSSAGLLEPAIKLGVVHMFG